MCKQIIRLIERIKTVIKNNGYIIKEIKGENNVIDFVLLANKEKNNESLFGNIVMDVSTNNTINTMSLNKNKLTVVMNVNSESIILNIVFIEEV